jgi:aminopeptidase N
LGEYPWKSYGTITLPADSAASGIIGEAALETVTKPIFGPGLSSDPSTLIHETCHQWMGDCVSIRNWENDIWWVEGFANFSEKMLLEHDHGHEDYESAMQELYESHRTGLWLRPGHLSADTMFSEASYSGGCLVFYALRRLLGDDRFFKVVRTFINRHRYGNASANDWVAVANQVTGQDLKPFFDAWLYGDREPSLAGDQNPLPLSLCSIR